MDDPDLFPFGIDQADGLGLDGIVDARSIFGRRRRHRRSSYVKISLSQSYAQKPTPKAQAEHRTDPQGNPSLSAVTQPSG
ncbi:hypothetical protein GCM10027396_31130 [Insolitispirillum peregrinum]